MTQKELTDYLLGMDDRDRNNLMGLSMMELPAIEKLIENAPTEEARKYVTVAKYIHLGESMRAGGA